MVFHYLMTEIRLLTRFKTRFILSTLLPLAFYLLFTNIINIPDEAATRVFYREYMYSMTTFSLLSFCLFSFPLDIIDERKRGWYKKLMHTPLSPFHYLLVKSIKTMCQFGLSIMIIFSVAALYKGVEMPWKEWFYSGFALWCGASLMLGMGALFAQLNDIQKASMIANIVYLGLALFGGLWFPLDQLPSFMQRIGHFTPSYHLKNLSYDIVLNHTFSITSLAVLVAYSILFLYVALYIRKRSELS